MKKKYVEQETTHNTISKTFFEKKIAQFKKWCADELCVKFLGIFRSNA